ncbi:MAG: TIM barrel protein [Rhodobacteraceae bacterium]|nr:TIM barrel protein [Paracoccaceae bacterium]
MRLLLAANTGFLWTHLPFVDRIRRAAACGFGAVEFHDEAQSADPSALAEALAETGLPVMGLNVRMGATSGCAAIPGAETSARRDIDAAAALAARLDAGAIHVLAGCTDAPGAGRVFAANLRHALAATDRTVLIEPICAAAKPGYFLNGIAQAAAIIDEIGHPRLKILFDWYHVLTEGTDAEAAFRAHAGAIGHVQIAALPGRSEPAPHGSPPYARLIPAMQAAGYRGAFGCEYRPAGGSVEAGLGWMTALADALAAPDAPQGVRD